MKLRRLLPVVALALVATACSGGDATNEADTPAPEETSAAATQEETAEAQETQEEEPSPEELTPVSYLTSFSTFGRDAYVYVAQEKGFFADQGLDVTINPGAGSVDVIGLVAAGQADFGAADAPTVMVVEAEQQLGVKAVAAVHQRTLSAVATVAGTGIETPADLEGRIFSDAPGSTNRILFPFFAEAAGFDADAVEFVPSAPPDLPKLLAAGQVDAIGQFVVGKGLIESVTGDEAVFFPYGEYLPDVYGIVTVTRDELIQSDPELVQRFVTALMQGLEYSIANPEETGEILARYVPEQNPAVAAGEVGLMAAYVSPEGFDAGIGSIDPDRIASMIDLLSEAGVLQGEITVDDVFAPGFVN